MTVELPTVNSKFMSAYYPNINNNQGELTNLESQYYLDELINNSISFKNRETILKQSCESTIDEILLIILIVRISIF